MMMKALVAVEPGKMIIEERVFPTIKKEKDVLIKVKAASICGSDIHLYHGTSPLASYPRVLGHEIVGEIVEVGSDVNLLNIGDKVVVEPIISCGECYACRNNRPNACLNLKVRCVHVDGGFQEYYIVPEKNLYKFDNDIPWEHATLIEPYTIGKQITWRADIKKKDFVFIIGAGPIGLCVLEMAKLIGGICIVSDLNEKRLNVAKKLGADYIFNPNHCNILDSVKSITNQEGPNVTIDAVCTPVTFEQAVDITSVAGRVMCLGFTKETSNIAQFGITVKELDIRGSRHQTFKFPEVVRLFNERKLNPEKLISNVFDFKDYQKAFDLASKPTENVCKIVMKF